MHLSTPSLSLKCCVRGRSCQDWCVNVYFRIWLMTNIDQKSPRGAQLVSQPSNSMIHSSWPHQASIKAASHHQPAVAARVIQKMGCLLTATSCLQRINLFQLSSDRTVTLQLLLLTLVSHHHTLLSQNTLFVLLRQLFSSFFLVFYPKQVTKANLLTLLQIDIAVLNTVWSIHLYYFVLWARVSLVCKNHSHILPLHSELSWCIVQRFHGIQKRCQKQIHHVMIVLELLFTRHSSTSQIQCLNLSGKSLSCNLNNFPQIF